MLIEFSTQLKPITALSSDLNWRRFMSTDPYVLDGGRKITEGMYFALGKIRGQYIVKLEHARRLLSPKKSGYDEYQVSEISWRYLLEKSIPR